MLGVSTGYLTDLAKLALPPGVVLDAAGGLPIKATVLLERDTAVQGEEWLYPGPLSVDQPQLAAYLGRSNSNLRAVESTLRRSHAYDVDVTIGKLILEGRRNQPIRVTNIRALVKDKGAPAPGGSVLLPGPQGAGGSTVIGFNLDEDDPVARDPRPNGSWWQPDFFTKPTFDSITLTLGKNEQQIFQFTARTFKFDVQWTIEITALVDGVLTTYEADYGGAPMRTSCLIEAPKDQADPSLEGVDKTKYSEIYVYSLSGDQRFDRAK